jgi:hypothetical protein
MHLGIRNTQKTALLILFTPTFYKLVKQTCLKGSFAVALLFSTKTLAVVPEIGVTSRCGNSELSLAVPEEWELTETQFAAVQCAFRGPGSGYPNVNVIREPYSKSDSALPLNRRVGDIIQSYKSIGLTDATPKKQEIVLISGVEVLEVTISYTSLERSMVAVVAIFPRENHLFTMTILDQQEAFRLSEPTARAIVRSVTFRELPPPLPPASTPTALHANSNVGVVFIIVAGFAVALFALLALVRLRNR